MGFHKLRPAKASSQKTPTGAPSFRVLCERVGFHDPVPLRILRGWPRFSACNHPGDGCPRFRGFRNLGFHKPDEITVSAPDDRVDGPPCPDGGFPIAGVALDKAGNLYGTTSYGGIDGQWGTVYELSPGLGGAWTQSTLHRFTSQTGGQPFSPVNFDSAGNLYGTASAAHRGDHGQCGNVWRLTRQSGNTFKAAVFVFDQSGADGCTPLAGVFMVNDANTVIGTTSSGGAFKGGTLFKITGTKHTVLYNFCQLSGCADGSAPSTSLTINGGALYSTTAKGGAFNQGAVYQIKR